MRRIIFILAGLPVLASGLSPAWAMNPAALQKEMAAGQITVVDIRSASEYAEEHIPGAINIPAAVCSAKRLPPIGRVVVYGTGLPGDLVKPAVAALAAKPGIQVDQLDGGLAGWKTARQSTTAQTEFKRETFHYITYAQLKAASPSGITLYDLRKAVAAGRPALTDLAREFPSAKQVQSHAAAMSSSGTQTTTVLIDSGDGTSEKTARLLKNSGIHNYAILIGGELAVSRHGQIGLQRAAQGIRSGFQTAPVGDATK